ncbi:uncharacterized protein Z518_07770 [Rhinocladiella mackenziei CBS 650.93]|uniref:Rhinocladiella mackenziei CBS 650.93 unplaced genomic scaffold supercont1.5, whole genome shotgun sequence n=1 Tax=Rhinocladiella mackenziei CBS 650.93 TaxID=1442369 RepID=A0A0D2IM16_9EURO|nr:uncharacterized protein Z518_07770 [Rhinocladiella mackenziei CBS 650.93]KIX04216.1 hypothetical protein Z518_07770 [Rhinocladiella mackenziei CBS 650.93]
MNPSDTPASSPTRSITQSSPGASVDSCSQSTTPFLHNLTQRLRKGSNASSQSSDLPPPPDPVTKTESTRAARRTLLSIVKDDWEYPSTAVKENPQIPHREPISYRLREESQSDLEAEEVFSRRCTKVDPYKFEDPDAVGNVIAERKRKRRRLLEEEMQWNEGLRIWSERRDAWTRAVKHRPREDQASPHSPSSSSKRPSHKSRLSRSLFPERNTLQSTDSSNSWPASPTSPTPESSSIDSIESTSSGELGPWLPIYPPLLPPDDTLRDRIKPAAYPTIYSKIVVQSMTPNVPIPLTHMIPALVEGWKAEGNWPPQPTAISAADAKKGRRSSAFSKWRKEHHHDTKAAELATGNEDGKSRVKRSIGMMRRVLGGMPSNGLDELGIEFCEQDEDEMERNVLLNKGLITH